MAVKLKLRSLVVRLAILSSVWLVIVKGLLHKSQTAELMGRYSTPFAAILAVLLIMGVEALFICIDSRRWGIVVNGIRDLGIRGVGMILIFVLMAQFVLFTFGDRLGFMGIILLVQALVLPVTVFPGLMDGWGSALNALAGRRTVQNVMVLLATVLLCIAAIEIYLRVEQPLVWKGGAYRPDPNIGFRYFGPGSNKYGFHDTVHEEEKPPGTWRLAVIGDSFAFRFVPLEKNFTTLLQKQAPTCRGQKTEVLNFGIPQTGPNQYLRIFLHEAVKYHPDAVLLGFYIGNDFFVTDPKWKEVVVNGRLEIRDMSDPKRFLPRNWFIGRYLHMLIWAWMEEEKLSAENKGIDPSHETRPMWSMETVTALEGEWLADLCTVPPSGKLLAQKAEVEKFLLDFRDTCRKENREFMMAIFPDQFQVYGDFLNMLISKRGLDGNKLDIERPQKWLKEFTAGAGIPCLDLLPALRQASGEPLYFKNDIHWNEKGNEIVARELAGFLNSSCHPQQISIP